MTSEETDGGIKYLLKQVYSAHTAKINALSAEIVSLKRKLHESERELKLQKAQCKRCTAMEVAYNTCQAAYQELAERLENLGEKFSVFNNSEKETLSKNGSILPPDGSGVHADNSVNPQLSKAVSEKPVKKQNLFKNLISFNPAENSDLNSLPLHQHFDLDYSTLNNDSLILVPDTVDIIGDASSKRIETSKNVSQLPKTKPKVTSVKDFKELNDEVILIVDNETECKETNRHAKKRFLTDSSDREKNSKKVSVVNDSIIKPTSKQESEVKSLDSQLGVGQKMRNENPNKVVPTIRTESINTEVDKLIPQIFTDDFVSLVKKSGTAINTTCSNKKKASPLDIEIPKIVTELDHHLEPEEQNDINFKDGTNVTLKDSQYQVSPSLLPVNKISEPILVEKGFVADDINDFVSPIVNKKQAKDDGAWTACDKKRLKKRQPVKIIKSTSKFKMHLDSLPPNYQKPTYRQTKLSKDLFQPKASTSSCITKAVQVLGDYNISSSSSEEGGQASLPVKISVKTGVIDLDATCIPDNYEIISSGNINKEKISNENLADPVRCVNLGELNEDSNGSTSSSPVCRKILNLSVEMGNTNNAVMSADYEDFFSNQKKTVDSDLLNSFDRLPKKEEPNYKYKEGAVRKKAERKQLNGFDCKECENYYSELGLSDKEKQERLKKCSRHRAKFAPPPTPEHFWELEFPDTEECKARGYLNETQQVKWKSHRRRPLDL